MKLLPSHNGKHPTRGKSANGSPKRQWIELFEPLHAHAACQHGQKPQRTARGLAWSRHGRDRAAILRTSTNGVTPGSFPGITAKHSLNQRVNPDFVAFAP